MSFRYSRSVSENYTGIGIFSYCGSHAMDVLELLKRRMAEGMPIDWQVRFYRVSMVIIINS